MRLYTLSIALVALLKVRPGSSIPSPGLSASSSSFQHGIGHHASFLRVRRLNQQSNEFLPRILTRSTDITGPSLVERAAVDVPDRVESTALQAVKVALSKREDIEPKDSLMQLESLDEESEECLDEMEVPEAGTSPAAVISKPASLQDSDSTSSNRAVASQPVQQKDQQPETQSSDFGHDTSKSVESTATDSKKPDGQQHDVVKKEKEWSYHHQGDSVNFHSVSVTHKEAPKPQQKGSIKTKLSQSVSGTLDSGDEVGSHPSNKGDISGPNGPKGVYSGKATFFTQNNNAGACGKKHSDSDLVVAIQSSMYQKGSLCGKTIAVTRHSTGKTINCIAADECPTCVSSGSLDLSVAAFKALGTPDEGIFEISWTIVD